MEMTNTSKFEGINDLRKRTLKDIDLLIKKLTEVKQFCCSEYCKRSDQSVNKLVREGPTSRSHSRSRIPLALTRLRRETNVNLSKCSQNSHLANFVPQTSCPLTSQSLILEREYGFQQNYDEKHSKFYRNKSLDRDLISKDLSTHDVKVEIDKDEQLTSPSSKSKIVKDNPNTDLTDLNSFVKDIPMQVINQNQLDCRDNMCKESSAFFKLHESLNLDNKKICRCKNFPKKKLEINLTCKDVPRDSITFEISQPDMTTLIMPDIKNVEDICITEPYQKCLAEHRKELDDKINQINYLRREARQNVQDKLGLGEVNSRAYRSW